MKNPTRTEIAYTNNVVAGEALQAGALGIPPQGLGNPSFETSFTPDFSPDPYDIHKPSVSGSGYNPYNDATLDYSKYQKEKYAENTMNNPWIPLIDRVFGPTFSSMTPKSKNTTPQKEINPLIFLPILLLL